MVSQTSILLLMVVSAAAVSAIPDTDANLQTAPPAATNSDIDFKKLGNFLTCLSKETQEPKVPLPVGDSLTGVLALNKCVLESYGPVSATPAPDAPIE